MKHCAHEAFPNVHVSEPAGQDLFALPASFGAALPEPETAVGTAAHIQPRPRSPRESSTHDLVFLVFF